MKIEFRDLPTGTEQGCDCDNIRGRGEISPRAPPRESNSKSECMSRNHASLDESIQLLGHAVQADLQLDRGVLGQSLDEAVLEIDINESWQSQSSQNTSISNDWGSYYTIQLLIPKSDGSADIQTGVAETRFCCYNEFESILIVYRYGAADC